MKWSCVTAFQICTASLVLLLFSRPVSSSDWLIGPQCHMHEGRGGWSSGSCGWGGVRWGEVGRWMEVARPRCGEGTAQRKMLGCAEDQAHVDYSV